MGANLQRRKPNVMPKRRIIGLPNDQLAFDRIVYLPFDLATVYAAEQNFRMDVAKGCHHNLAVWEDVQHSYLEEALQILKDQACNLFPGNNDEPWIHVNTIGLLKMPSQRGAALMGILNVLFSKGDVDLLKDKLFPHPRVVNHDRMIGQLTTAVNARFCFH